MAAELSRTPDKYQCNTCKERHCDTTRTIKGSVGAAPFQKYEIKIGREVIYLAAVCPLPSVTDESREWLRYHMHYKNNILPRSGGMDDQPALFSAAMEIIERVISYDK